MKTISVSVSPDDYEAFRKAAKDQGRPIAGLIREAMAIYRAERIPERTPLESVPVLAGLRPIGSLPSRAQLYDEIFGDDAPEAAHGEDDGRP